MFVHWTGTDGATRLAGQLDEVGRGAASLQRFTYNPAWLAGAGFPLGEGMVCDASALLPVGGGSEFGVLADAGPDGWGRRVLARRPEPPRTPTGFLMAAADETRQGALRFSIEPDGPFVSDGGFEPIESLDALYQEVREFQKGSASPGRTSRLLRAGTSQGGFRPKAAVRDDAGNLWIAKFPSETDTYDIETCEAAALDVARQAGLDVPQFRHIRVDADRAILLVRRFDRTATGRVGYQSMRTASRQGIDEPLDYQLMAATAGLLSGTAGRLAIVAAAALNITVNNVDDHSRNFGFLQDDRGQWRTAPLFDIAPGRARAEPTALVAGSSRSIEQLLDLEWAVPRRRVEQLVHRVVTVARNVFQVARTEYGHDPDVAENLERFRAAVAGDPPLTPPSG